MGARGRLAFSSVTSRTALSTSLSSFIRSYIHINRTRCSVSSTSPSPESLHSRIVKTSPKPPFLASSSAHNHNYTAAIEASLLVSLRHGRSAIHSDVWYKHRSHTLTSNGAHEERWQQARCQRNQHFWPRRRGGAQGHFKLIEASKAPQSFKGRCFDSILFSSCADK
jgi:hypothetical protein